MPGAWEGEVAVPRARHRRARVEAVRAAHHAVGRVGQLGKEEIVSLREDAARAGPEAGLPVEAGAAADPEPAASEAVGRDRRVRSQERVRVAGHEVDDAEERVRAVERRARPAHDLDALDVHQIAPRVVAHVARPEEIVVHHVTVGQREDAVAVVLRLTEAAKTE